MSYTVTRGLPRLCEPSIVILFHLPVLLTDGKAAAASLERVPPWLQCNQGANGDGTTKHVAAHANWNRNASIAASMNRHDMRVAERLVYNTLAI